MKENKKIYRYRDLFMNNPNKSTKPQVRGPFSVFGEDFLPEQNLNKNEESAGQGPFSSRTILEQVGAIEGEIGAKLAERDRWAALRDRLTCGGWGGTVQSSLGPVDSIAEAVARILDVEAEILRDVRRLVEARERASLLIGRAADARRREVLVRRYLARQTWDALAEAMGITRQWALELHKRALLEIDAVCARE